MTRKEAIAHIQAMIDCNKHCTDPQYICEDCDNCSLNYEKGNMGEIIQSLEMALNSLKTDEAYQLEYEKTTAKTNGDMIRVIFPSAEIDKGKDGNDIWIAIDCWTTFTKEWWNAPYKENRDGNDG